MASVFRVQKAQGFVTFIGQKPLADKWDKYRDKAAAADETRGHRRIDRQAADN